MFDSIIQTIGEYPYIGVALIFLLCGLGLPLPEEVVLIAGGYICAKYPERAELHWMMTWCAAGILAGDLLPYVLGRVFGARILRLRWMRLMVTRKRLAVFDRWFRKRGDLVIFIARFLAGIRSIAFFTAGMMKMRWRRFLLLDGLGIVLIVPLLVWLGHRGAGVIDDVISRVKAVERGILVLATIAAVLGGTWYWLHKRRRRLADAKAPSETFVKPQLPVRDESEDATGTDEPTGAALDTATPDPVAGAPSPAAGPPASPGHSGTPPAKAPGSGAARPGSDPGAASPDDTAPPAPPSAAAPTPPAGPSSSPPLPNGPGREPLDGRRVNGTAAATDSGKPDAEPPPPPAP